MPRIPLSEGRQLLPQRHDAVHAPMSIAGDFGMDDSRAMIHAADRIRGAGEKIAGAGLAFASALVDRENRLAAAEDRNLLTRLGGELETMIRNSPGASDEEKENWIRGYQQKYEDERREFVDKMSANFRKQHDVEIAGIRTRFANNRNAIIIQGKVTRLYDHTMALAKNYALANDAENYKRTLDEARSGQVPLISQEQYDTLMLEYPRLADFGAARAAVDANTVDIDKKLVEKKDGKYVHFTNLTPQQREQLHRTALVKRHETETEQDNAYLAGLNDGSITDTPEDLKAAHDAKWISDAQYNRRLPWVKALAKGRIVKEFSYELEQMDSTTGVRDGIEEDFANGKIDEFTRDVQIEVLDKRERAAEKAANAAGSRWSQERERQRKDKIAAFRLRVEMEDFSSDPSINVEQTKAFLGELEKAFPDDLVTQQKLRKQILDTARAGAEGKREFSSPEGKLVLKFIQNEYRNADGTYRNLVYDKHWYGDGDNSQNYMAARYYEIMDYAKKLLADGKGADFVIGEIKSSVETIKDGIAKEILDRRTGERAKPQPKVQHDYAVTPDGDVIDLGPKQTPAQPDPGVEKALPGRQVVRRGKYNGKTVVKYSDGSVEYQNGNR